MSILTSQISAVKAIVLPLTAFVSWFVLGDYLLVKHASPLMEFV